MTTPDAASPQEPPAPPPSVAMRLVGLLLLVAPLAGAVFHLAFYLLAPDDARIAYVKGPVIMVVVFAAFANLAACILLYFRRRMRLLFWARVASYLWIMSLVPYIRVLIYG